MAAGVLPRRRGAARDLCRGRPDLLPEVERRVAVLRRVAALGAGTADAPAGPAPGGAGTLSHAGPADADTAPHDGTHASAAPVGAAPPGYEVLGELGRGGMGVVYRARDTRLNRDVALKMVPRAGAGRLTVARFWAEAEVMAAVKHPHVVQVYELGEHDGRPFLAMELVPGGSLEARLADGPLAPRAAAELVARIAAGAAAAHEQGVVHRDLKPGNVLLAGDGSPKVTDFGIAKRRAHDLTQTEALIGTPAYMAPEQAAGRAKFVGPQADVWALGVILYECLCGKRPFAAETREGLLAQIQSAEPAALRSWLGSVPRDLDTIVSKCLAKEPEHRYPTAAELATDLGRFLAGEPIAARPVGSAERLARWVRRKPTAAAAYGLSALAVLLAVVVFVVFGFWRAAENSRDQLAGEKERTEAARDEAARLQGVAEGLFQDADSARRGETAAKKEVERQREKLARIEYGRTIQVAYQAWKDNKVAEARALLAGTRENLRGWEYDYVHRLCHADVLSLDGPSPKVTFAAFSPDGSKVVTVSGLVARVWDAATGRAVVDLRVRGHTRLNITRAAFSPDGSRVVTVGHEDWSARVWDTATGKPVVELIGHAAPISNAMFSPDGSKILTYQSGTYGNIQTGKETKGVARLWDAATGKAIAELSEHPGAINRAAFSPDGSKVVTVGGQRTRLWDSTTGKMTAEFIDFLVRKKESDGPLNGGKTVDLRDLLAAGGSLVAYSPNGSRIVTGGYDRPTLVWGAATGRVAAELKGHTDYLTSAVFNHDGSKVLTASEDKTARIWDAATGRHLIELKGHTHRLSSATLSPDGSKVVTASFDRTARLWDATTGVQLIELRGHTGLISTASFNHDGSRVVTAGQDDSAARVWDATTGKAVVELKEVSGPALRASFSPDGSRILTTGGGPKGGWPARYARAWDAETGAQLAEYGRPEAKSPPPAGGGRQVHGTAYSADGTRVVTVGVAFGRVPGKTPGPGFVFGGALGNALGPPPGQMKTTDTLIASVRDAATGKLLAEFAHAGFRVYSVSLNRDGSRVVTTDGVARVWDVATQKVVAEFRGHTKDVQAVSFSPDGSRVVSTGDGTARVWDAATGTQLLVLEGAVHVRTSGSGAVFSPDGTRIVAGDWKGTARVWDAATGKLLVEMRGYAAVGAVAFSPDGSRVVTASEDGTGWSGDGLLRVWDADTGAELLALPGANFASFSPDGTRVLTQGPEALTIYDARPVNRAFLRLTTAPQPREVNR